MEEQRKNSVTSEEFLFSHLIAMFQTLALQQLGKLTSPVSGKLERDLQQAKITIDMLEMINNKMKGNLNEREKKLLGGVLMELQMNYVDESKKKDQAGEMEEEAGGEEEDEDKNKNE